MLYSIIGTDIEKTRARSRALVDTLREKRPDASFFRLHLVNWDPNTFAELSRSIGLFSSKYIILLDNLLTGSAEKKFDKEKTIEKFAGKAGKNANEAFAGIGGTGIAEGTPSEMILESLASLKASDHVWIIVEDALFGKSTGKDLGVKESKELASIEVALKKNSDKIEMHDSVPSIARTSKESAGAQGAVPYRAPVKKKFGPGALSSFTFTDAFFDKDHIKAINTLTLLERDGVAAEEIHGALWWQAKILFQVAKKETRGLSPFVLQKSSRFAKKWTNAELERLSNSIVDSYHQAHQGKIDLYNAMVGLSLAAGK